MKYTAVKIVGGVIGGVLLLLTLAFAVFAIVGGGLGEKSDLPSKLLNRDQPIIFAHRAAPNNYPENTWAGMRLAREKGFPGLEVDVQLSRDSVFVAFHDSRVDQWLKIPGLVTQMTLAELQQPPLYFRGRPTDQHIVTLDSVANVFKNDFVIFFDMKRAHHHSIFKLAALIDQYLGEHDAYETIIVANGYLPFIAYLEYRYPRVITCLQGFRPSFSPLFNLLPRKFQPDFIACDMNWIEPGFLDWLTKNRMGDRFIAYGVKQNTFTEFREMNLRHYIVTYRPFLDSLLREYQDKRSRK